MKATKNVVPLSRDIYNKIICLFQKEEFVDIQKNCEQNEVLTDYVYSELKDFFINNEQNEYCSNANKKISFKFKLFKLLQKIFGIYEDGLYLYMDKDNGELYLANKFNMINGEFMENGFAITNLFNRIAYDIDKNILDDEFELNVFLEGDILNQNSNEKSVELDFEPLNKFINNYIKDIFSNKMVDFAVEPTSFFEKMFLDNKLPVGLDMMRDHYPSLSLNILKNEEVRSLLGFDITIKNIKSSIENYKGDRSDSIVEYIKELYIFMLNDIKQKGFLTKDQLELFNLSSDLHSIIEELIHTDDKLSSLIDEFHYLFWNNVLLKYELESDKIFGYSHERFFRKSLGSIIGFSEAPLVITDKLILKCLKDEENLNDLIGFLYRVRYMCVKSEGYSLEEKKYILVPSCYNDKAYEKFLCEILENNKKESLIETISSNIIIKYADIEYIQTDDCKNKRIEKEYIPNITQGNFTYFEKLINEFKFETNIPAEILEKFK